MPKHLVVIGGGQAAVQTIQTARQIGFDGEVTLIGEEQDAPYQRPPLSKKYLAGKLARERLSLKPDTFYSNRDVQLKLGVRAEKLDLTKQTVRLTDDRRIDYDHLVLATGSRARRIDMPGSDLNSIHYVRSIADVDAIREQLNPQTRLVIVGGGYIGLEIAAVAIELGLDVTVLEAADRVLARVVCREMSEFFESYHRQAGVQIHCGAQVSGFTGAQRVEAVQTASGDRFLCDLVIVAIGILPNVELAEHAGLECGNGIRVDSCARTQDARVLAAGDCTNHPHPLIGRNIRLESVHNAVEQAKTAARSLMGNFSPFEDVPWFWSEQYDLRLQIAGLALDYDEVVIRGDIGSKSFAVYYLAQERLAAVDAVNSPRDFINGKKLVAARLRLSAAEIADPESDLTKYLTEG